MWWFLGWYHPKNHHTTLELSRYVFCLCLELQVVWYEYGFLDLSIKGKIGAKISSDPYIFMGRMGGWSRQCRRCSGSGWLAQRCLPGFNVEKGTFYWNPTPKGRCSVNPTNSGECSYLSGVQGYDVGVRRKRILVAMPFLWPTLPRVGEQVLSERRSLSKCLGNENKKSWSDKAFTQLQEFQPFPVPNAQFV